jgi:tRNA (guanine-N7-)-methyltransferase
VLKKGGFLNLKTDSDFLYDYSLEVMKTRGEKIEIASPNIYPEMQNFGFNETEKQVLLIKTHYEKMFVDKGHKISYLKVSSQNG